MPLYVVGKMMLKVCSQYVLFCKQHEDSVQEKTRNNALGQTVSEYGQMYSDSPIFQGQSTEQDSQVS